MEKLRNGKNVKIKKKKLERWKTEYRNGKTMKLGKLQKGGNFENGRTGKMGNWETEKTDKRENWNTSKKKKKIGKLGN